MNRREFIFSCGAFCLSAADAARLPRTGRPALSFGVISDLHLTTPASTAKLERALRYFRERETDAVMACGDLSDWGVKSGLKLLAETFAKVFPDGKGKGGRETVKLFCTGNHDYEGWWYPDMLLDMQINGQSEDESLVKLGMDACWEEAFGERFEPIRLRTVKGYQFLSVEYGHQSELGAWMATHGSEIDRTKPLFHFQHMPLPCTALSSGSADPKGKRAARKGGTHVRTVLEGFPNAISFTGHTHQPYTNEKTIWQGAFTAITVPSLSHAGLPGGYENGSDARDGTSERPMQPLPVRFGGQGGTGFFVSVFDDRVEVERRDFEEDDAGAPTWVIPLGTSDRPFAVGARDAAYPVPQFPEGSKVAIRTRNACDRRGKWMIALQCAFPSAQTALGARVTDYEIEAAPEDGSPAVLKRFLSPAFHRHPKHEPKVQNFHFNAKDLPREKPYRIKVYARNCFGARSRPLVSAVWCGKPLNPARVPKG